MVKESTSSKWQKIDFELFEEQLKENKYKNIYVDIITMVKTTITIEEYQIIINKLHLIISNNDETEITIDIDPQPQIYIKNNQIYKLDYDYGTEIVLNFFN